MHAEFVPRALWRGTTLCTTAPSKKCVLLAKRDCLQGHFGRSATTTHRQCGPFLPLRHNNRSIEKRVFINILG